MVFHNLEKSIQSIGLITKRGFWVWGPGGGGGGEGWGRGGGGVGEGWGRGGGGRQVFSTLARVQGIMPCDMFRARETTNQLDDVATLTLNPKP